MIFSYYIFKFYGADADDNLVTVRIFLKKYTHWIPFNQNCPQHPEILIFRIIQSFLSGVHLLSFVSTFNLDSNAHPANNRFQINHRQTKSDANKKVRISCWKEFKITLFGWLLLWAQLRMYKLRACAKHVMAK